MIVKSNCTKWKNGGDKMENYYIEINVKRIMDIKGISIQTVLDEMGWKSVSTFYKKVNGKSNFSIAEALLISKILKEPIYKIFILKKSKTESCEEM